MKCLSFFSIALSAALTANALGASVESWTVDPVHTTAQFTGKHFGIVPVVGTIPVTRATVKLRSDSQIPVEVSAELDPANLDTHNGMRDGDLRSAHFFDVTTYPKMSFLSTKISGNNPKNFTIAGDLTMHGQTHPITLTVQTVGQGKTPRGREFIAYTATGSIDRTQWGMTYGPVIVGNTIDIALTVEADKPS